MSPPKFEPFKTQVPPKYTHELCHLPIINALLEWEGFNSVELMGEHSHTQVQMGGQPIAQLRLQEIEGGEYFGIPNLAKNMPTIMFPTFRHIEQWSALTWFMFSFLQKLDKGFSKIGCSNVHSTLLVMVGWSMKPMHLVCECPTLERSTSHY